MSKVLLISLLTLTEKPYEDYNELLGEIKLQLETEERVSLFEKTLAEELPLTTARRAYQTAIRVALGVKDVYREYHGHAQKHNGHAQKHNKAAATNRILVCSSKIMNYVVLCSERL
jgi:hypothetical protein